MEDPRIISALFIFLKMAYYNVLINNSHCGYLSPNEYEEQYLENIEENAVKIAS